MEFYPINQLDKETLLFSPAIPEHNALRTVLAFPSTYNVGITSLGFQVVWATLAKRKDVDVRRLFTDQGDRTHQNLELFGISLSWELDGPVLLDLLEHQKIPIWSNQRNEKDPIVFGGGPVLTANPEPFAPFLDVVLLGDGEELIPNFIQRIKEYRLASRKERLHTLAKLPGVYVPSLYQPKYNSEGSLISISPLSPDIPESIVKQTWKGKTLSHSKVITPDAAWPNIHMVEVVRSCPELCRFCLASYLTLPFRSSDVQDGLIPAIEKGLTATKRIGLLGASITQHPEFNDLLAWLNNEKFNDIRLSLSSVRASTVKPELTEILKKRGCKSITMAIESGSSRIREVINKKLSNEEIYAAVRYAYEGGLTGVKLYGMVGLPSEKEEDIEETVKLLLQLKQATSGLRLTFGVSTFVPKAHTPFQWYGVRAESKKHLKQLAKKLQPQGINLRPESFGWSLIQALLARSDRRIAPIIEAVRGSQNSLGKWKQAYKQAYDNKNDRYNLGPLPSWEEVIHQNWDSKRILPWTHLQGPVKEEILIKHQLQSFHRNDC